MELFRIFQPDMDTFRRSRSDQLPLLLPAAAGGLLGAFLLERTSPRRLRRLFAAVILVSGIRMLF